MSSDLHKVRPGEPLRIPARAYNAFVDAVAERLGVPASEVQAREERTPSLVERLA